MNRWIAFAWLVAIGTNVAGYHSESTPYQGALILAGAVYFAVAYHRELLRLSFFPDFVLVLGGLAVPLLLMLLSDRSFERGSFTSVAAVAATFVVAAILAMRDDLARTLAFGAFTIVAIGAGLNLYELLVQNNVWSISPGRSAGLYVNPNISGEALVGYGLVFLLLRTGRIAWLDLTAIALVLLGVLATFSRGGVLVGSALIMAAMVLRAQRGQLLRTVVGGAAVVVLVAAFAIFVVGSLQLSEDALVRVFSLLESGGIGDYDVERGEAALAALDLAIAQPVFGAGVGTIYHMPQGPHNMFLAMMVDYGAVGLVIYVAVIVRLLIGARRGNRSVSGVVWCVVGWLVLFGLTSHNLLGNPATIPLLGLAVAGAYQARRVETASIAAPEPLGRAP